MLRKLFDLIIRLTSFSVIISKHGATQLTDDQADWYFEQLARIDRR